MNKTIGILAHVDAGKTTFAEQILYHTNAIVNRGRVDYKNTFLDNHYIERKRGITIFSEQANFTYKDENYYLIDTPGHVDFSSEMERSISIMDYAIIIISAVEGIQGHTETVWNLLRKNNVPTFIFINKIDRNGADIDKVLKEIQTNFTKDVFLVDKDLSKEDLDENFIEFIAEKNDMLFETYIENKYDKELWMRYIVKFIKENQLFLCFSGSALQDIGIEKFLNNLSLLTYTKYDSCEKFGGVVYKIKHDDKGNRLTYIKALSGNLKVKEYVNFKKEGNEKVNEIRIYNGTKFNTVDEVQAGQIFTVTGLTKVVAGDKLGLLENSIKYEMVPTLKSKVIFEENINVKDVLKCFKILESEDPTLKITWDIELKEIQVSIMGVIQLEIMKEILKERFNMVVDFGECEILYKETINGKAIGYGHFEPLKHYAEVHLMLEPLKRNTGIKFENICHADDLSIGNQNLIKHHIYEKEHKGILTGSGLTDLKVTLLKGRAHNKHTSGGDFREATLRALRQGLEQVENILLEPYYRFKIEIDLDNIGKVLSDMQKLNGTFEEPEIFKDKAIIRGRGPVSTFMNYNIEFIAFTKGRGRLNFIYDGYDLCHNSEKVINLVGYDKNLDKEYTSNSVFCSKGQSFVVKGNEAKNYMHCLLK